MRLFLMTSDTIDVLYILHFYLCSQKYLKPGGKNVLGLEIFFILRNCNKLSIKNECYRKSTKINALEQEICACHSLDNNVYLANFK